MDPFYLDQEPNDSQYSRSRPSSRASFTGTNFQSLEVAGDNNLSNIDQESICSRSASENSNPYLSPISQVPSTFISAPTPTPELYSPHPLLSEPSVGSEWSLFATTESSDSSCTIVEPAEDMRYVRKTESVRSLISLRRRLQIPRLRWTDELCNVELMSTANFETKLSRWDLEYWRAYSILGIQYDSRFEAGSRPSSYPWPGKIDQCKKAAVS